MGTEQIERLKALCRTWDCAFQSEAPLSEHTTFQIGGPCDLLILPRSSQALTEICSFLQSERIPYWVIGKGSNLLVSDLGYRGVILKLGEAFSSIQCDGNVLVCESGAALKDVCCAARDAGLTGLEFAYGIPGSVGGGVYMNAGAYGGELSDVVEAVEYLGADLRLHRISGEELQFSYRHSIFAEPAMKSTVITRVWMRLAAGERSQIQSQMDTLLQRRNEKQPLRYPSAGSTFKRPEGSYASLLIEQCGLKGRTVGGAQVSEQHSGFVINRGGATCSDVLELTNQVRQIVQEKTGFVLELEPILLGEFGATAREKGAEEES